MSSEDIEIVLKPMNISTTHKKEVKMTVSTYQLVGDLAQTLITIMGIKEVSPSDANFLYSGRMLDHSKTFSEENIQNGVKIIFTLKRKIPDVKATTAPVVTSQPVQKVQPSQPLPQKIEQKPPVTGPS